MLRKKRQLTFAGLLVTLFPLDGFPLTIFPAIGRSRFVAFARLLHYPATTRLAARPKFGPLAPSTIDHWKQSYRKSNLFSNVSGKWLNIKTWEDKRKNDAIRTRMGKHYYTGHFFEVWTFLICRSELNKTHYSRHIIYVKYNHSATLWLLIWSLNIDAS